MIRFRAVIGFAVLLAACASGTQVPSSDSSPASAMEITSSAFDHGASIPSTFTCDGENINPPLQFSDIPDGAQSLVLIVDDPDAPVGTFTHWTLWNVDPSTTEIPENSSPSGAVEGQTSFGSTGYGGPCPPDGEHRYFFKLYALSGTLDLASGAGVEQLQAAMEGSVLAEAQLMGLYDRQ